MNTVCPRNAARGAFAFLLATVISVVSAQTPAPGRETSAASVAPYALADQMPVDPFNMDFGAFGDRYFQSSGDRVQDWMAGADTEVESGAFDCGAEAGSLDFEVLGKPVGDATHHIIDESTARPVHCFRPAVV